MNLIEQAKNYVAEKVANMPMPEATIVDVDLKGFGLDGITLLAEISVSNPYSVPIPIGEIAYVVKSADRELASGTIPDLVSLKADEKTMLDVTVQAAHHRSAAHRKHHDSDFVQGRDKWGRTLP
ncbi:late embryogenesis abundant protein [Striga asiatica]|uniref:Late embryogenesis abundant protein n=1 Tax=Striga asiatica TaxID=4170 RepID=A0A5A7PER2_STRAF|nr:late embryogenesis abundant protein [Striga asiatica]